MKYYLDTNIIIYSINGAFPALPEHFKKVPVQSILIPDIVIAEIEYGARKSNDYEKTIQKYNCFTDAFIKVPFTGKAPVYYGQIRSTLKKTGKPIGPNDLIIAATVLAEDGILVTHNKKEFERVHGLKIEDWTE